jgi:hypothetical protein
LAAASRDRPGPAALAASYRDLTEAGLAPPEAANVTAYLAGLRPAAGGWTIEEVGRLLFLRHRLERSRARALPEGATVAAREVQD